MRCEATGKIMFTSRQAARRRISVGARRGYGSSHGRLHPYECEECHHWHIGHGD